MASTFRILASPASFIKGDGYDMVSVAMMSTPLADRTVTVANVDALAAEVAPIRAQLDAAGTPYSLRVNLVRGSRAPRGWNDHPRRFHRDESFGIYQD